MRASGRIRRPPKRYRPDDSEDEPENTESGGELESTDDSEFEPATDEEQRPRRRRGRCGRNGSRRSKKRPSACEAGCFAALTSVRNSIIARCAAFLLVASRV